MAKAKVVVGSLGGTISMTAEPDKEGVTSTLTAQDLVDNVPEVHDIAEVKAEHIEGISSADMSFEQALMCLKWAKKQVQQGADGVVLTQGTDTLEESAFLFDLLWDLDPPLIITGAMRCPPQAGDEGPANVLDAVCVAASENSRKRGALVVMNDRIHEARWVAKSHTSNVDAFQSQTGACGAIIEKKVHYFKAPPKRKFLPIPDDIDSKVFLWEPTLGESPDVLQWAADSGYRAIVIASFGMGHVSKRTAELVERLTKDIPVVICSRTGQGSTGYKTYGFDGSEIDLQRKGALMGGWLPSRKARLLLWTITANGLPMSAFDEYLDTLTY